MVTSLLRISGKDTVRGVFTTRREDGSRLLVDATAQVVHERHRAAGRGGDRADVRPTGPKASCREPRLAAVYANLLAAPGDGAALRQATDVCDEALLFCDGGTFDGWTELGAKRAQPRT